MTRAEHIESLRDELRRYTTIILRKDEAERYIAALASPLPAEAAVPEAWELEAAAVFMDHVDDDETGSVHRVAAFLRRVAALTQEATPAADLIAVEPVAVEPDRLGMIVRYLHSIAKGSLRDRDGTPVDDPLVIEAAASLASLSARLVEVERERDAARTVHRWSVDDSGNGVLHVCRSQHAKEDKCEWEAFVPLARAEAAEAKLAEAGKDAERWKALLRCARIRMQGSAGFDPKTGERQEYSNATGKYEKTDAGWVHFGAEFWSIYPGHEDEDRENRWGTRALIALADDVLLKEKAAHASIREAQ